MDSAIKVGDFVERINSGYRSGDRGEVREVSEGRARVFWPQSKPPKRTWVAFRFLKVIPSNVAMFGYQDGK